MIKRVERDAKGVISFYNDKSELIDRFHEDNIERVSRDYRPDFSYSNIKIYFKSGAEKGFAIKIEDIADSITFS